MRINNYPLIIDAAKRGAGIALGWRHLIDDDITNGSLVRPVEGSVKTHYAYHIAWPFNDTLSPVAERFNP